MLPSKRYAVSIYSRKPNGDEKLSTLVINADTPNEAYIKASSIIKLENFSYTAWQSKEIVEDVTV